MVPDSTVTLPLDAAITDKSSAQDIIRSLKNSAASLVHRLSLANTLWHSRTVYLPGKTELLLDWITVLLVRSIPTSNNNNKNNKNNNNTAAAAAATGNASTQNSSSRIDALAYQSSDAWSFLLTILVSIDKNLSDSLTTEQAWSLQLKVPLLPLFTAIVRWSSQNTDTDTELPLILPIAQQVFRLTTSTLAYTAGISVDQLSQLSLDVLHTLNSLVQMPLACVADTRGLCPVDSRTKHQKRIPSAVILRRIMRGTGDASRSLGSKQGIRNYDWFYPRSLWTLLINGELCEPSVEGSSHTAAAAGFLLPSLCRSAALDASSPSSSSAFAVLLLSVENKIFTLCDFPSFSKNESQKISLLSVRCVAVLESVIRKMLPAQSMALLIQFQEELFEHYSANHLNA
ncbi:hypothetical protein BASA60_004503 [Batrachochytrium salamandrivorans]|nr:hypothetical protein BASA60_004503 [Batrachochytrium salamandrivorans]